MLRRSLPVCGFHSFRREVATAVASKPIFIVAKSPALHFLSLVDEIAHRYRHFSSNGAFAPAIFVSAMRDSFGTTLSSNSNNPNENDKNDKKGELNEKNGDSPRKHGPHAPPEPSYGKKTKPQSSDVAKNGNEENVKKGDASKKDKKGDDDDDDGDDSAPGNQTSGSDDIVNKFLSRVTAGVFCVTAMAVGAWYFAFPVGRHVGWRELYSRANDVDSVNVYNEYAQFSLGDEQMFVGIRPSNTSYTDEQVRALLAQRSPESERVPVSFVGEPLGLRFLHFIETWSFVVPFIFFPLFTLVVSRAAASIVYDNAKLTTAIGTRREHLLTQAGEAFQIAKRTSVRFRDIAGMTEAKSEIVEIVDFLKFPERYTRMGAKIPAGALLLGPPGTGKTMLAKAVAGESATPFIACTGSDFVELYAGMGALRVRKLFELARTQKKCIIYIDEIDAIGCKRTGSGMGEQSEQEHTLNELLTQLDGFNKEKDRIIVLASTNAEQSLLDTALIRPGRFDRLINVEAPVLNERITLFETYLRGLKLLPNASDAVPAVVDSSTAAVVSGGDAASVVSAVVSDPATPVSPSTTNGAANNDTTTMTLVCIPQQKLDEKVADIFSSTSNVAIDAAAANSNTQNEIKAKSADGEAAAETTDAASAVEGDEKDDKERNKKYPNEATPEFLAIVSDFAKRMSGLCPGFVGADIASVCNEAAILAAREAKNVVTMSHLERSIDRVLAGIEHRSRVLSDFEKRVVAHHEAGHAVAGWFLGRADPLMKVSIVPRGGKALGYAQYLPDENQLRTSAQIEDSICVTLGGRVAERIFFDHLSTGASDDLQKVRYMAYTHAASFGRNTAIAAPGSSSTRYSKPYGEQTEKSIDDAAKQLVDRLYQRTYDLLSKHKTLMGQLAQHLLTHEVLTHADIVHYLGSRMPRPNDQHNIF